MELGCITSSGGSFPSSHPEVVLNMLRLSAVMVGTKQPRILSAFYEKVFGKPAEIIDDQNGFYGWPLGGAFFAVMDHSEMEGNAKDPGRVLFNFGTTQVQEEFERIRLLGGVAIREPYEMGGQWIATLADPDGNYFQLVPEYPID